jgi:hypothetical protein
MIKFLVNLLACCSSVFLLSACSLTNNKPVLIDFTADSTAITFNNIDPAGLLKLQSLDKGDSILHQLISVLETPSERDSTVKEQEITGDIMATDSNLVFIPAHPFIRGRDYLVVTHLNAEFGELKDLLSGDLANRIRPVQQLLTR